MPSLAPFPAPATAPVPRAALPSPVPAALPLLAALPSLTPFPVLTPLAALTPPARSSVPALPRQRQRRRSDAVPALIMVALAAVLVGNGAALALAQAGPAPAPTPAPPVALVGTLPEVVPFTGRATTGEIEAEAPPPRSVVVERIGVDRELIDLDVLADGTLEVPEDPDDVGWHRGGTLPGDPGPAVLVGHVDSYEGGAVFFRLRELVPGDRVAVTRVDGSVVDFEVYGLETVAKDAFPTDRVYGATADAELRLVTCGGTFDEATRSYTENVVVYARQLPGEVVS